MQTVTRRYHDLIYFLGGVFLANMGLYFHKAVSGDPFPARFASPPGEGLSPSTRNVLWGLLNLAIACGLVTRVGRFDLRKTRHVAALGLGFLIFSLLMALI